MISTHFDAFNIIEIGSHSMTGTSTNVAMSELQKAMIAGPNGGAINLNF